MRDQLELQKRLTTQLYEGVLTDDGWKDALHTISEFTGSPQASVIVLDTRRKTLAVNETFGMPHETAEAYNAYYNQLDEGNAFIDTTPWGGWYLDKRDFSERAIQKSAFYQDFMLRHEMSTTLCNRMFAMGSSEAYLSLQRRPGQKEYTGRELTTFSKIIPHVQNAVRIRLHMQSLSERAGLASMVLDHLQVPLLVLDEFGNILLSNAACEQLMRQQPRLTLRNGCLQPAGLKPGHFNQMLESACGRQGTAIASGALLPSVAGQHALQLLMLPLPTKLQAFNTWSRPLALLVLNTPNASHGDPYVLLQQIYGLTPAETRVALSLCQGDIPKEIALRNGVSVDTIRFQLKTVFAKTGVNRQTDLIRLLAPMKLFEHAT